MRLLRLELQGFKSFLDRTVLTFKPGITGVVGPNGCGKSNIVDAILWVMGEQSPKHLRGDTMTDIIFNGSDSRAATSMAEVSLVMDRKGVVLSPQFAAFDHGDEISITRRIYRDGTGEYLINKIICRLKDIHELFMDTGVGRRAYSIIEQGQIDRMINVKPEERRYLFEEVAGITKYKAKRKEAEKRLELTRQNLVRIHDIIAELEKQIRSLKIQATRARKYKEIKTELEVVDLHILGRSLSLHSEALLSLSQLKDTLNAERSEADAQYGQQDAELTELEITRIDQEKGYESLNAKERELSLTLQRLEGLLSLVEERKKFIQQNLEALAGEDQELGTGKAAREAERDATAQEQSGLGEGLSQLEETLLELERSLKIGQHEKLTISQQVEEIEDEATRLSEREISLKHQIEYSVTKLHDIESSLDTLQTRLSEVVQHIETQRAFVSQTEEKITDCGMRHELANSAATTLYTEVQQTSDLLSTKEDELFQFRDNFGQKRSRLDSLVELQTNLEGYSPTAKEILTQLAESGGTAVPLAECLQPEAGLEDLVELLLGNDMNTLVVQTSEEVERVARLIEEKELERVRIVAVADVGTIATPQFPEGVVPLLTRVRIKEGYNAIAQRWLGNVALCNDAAQIFELRKAYPDLTLLASGSRLIAHSDRTLSSGTAQTKMGVFARRREIEELTQVCEALQTQVDGATAERERLLKQLEDQEQQHSELKDKLSDLHIESVELRKEREKGLFELGRSEKDQGQVNSEMGRYQGQHENILAQKSSWDEELSGVRTEMENTAQSTQELELQLSALTDQLEAQAETVNEKRVERSVLSEKLNSIQYKIEKVEGEIRGIINRQENIQVQVVQDQKEFERLGAEMETSVVEQATLTTQKNETLVEMADLKAAFNFTCTRIQDLRLLKDELQDRRSELVEKLQETELKIAHEASQAEQIKNLSIERYGRSPEALSAEVKLPAEQVPLLAAQIEMTWDLLLSNEQEDLLREHLKNLKEKIDRYGEVNLTAIQEFDEVQGRYDFLTNQKTDLDNSIKILEDAIIKIDDSTKTRFQETFEAVNRKFKEIFPILFNGGKAELALTNPDNLLESGVDVMVQPPGKRLQSITLLSGGEKALTAVSLILAIFARKPSPFCLLDEVDAPLDDANVSRFNTVIRKMAEKTQFIVITHNKKTMEIAEALYGVTMERAGISKMTSVQMS